MLIILAGLAILATIGGIIAVVFLPFNSEDYKKCQHCSKRVEIETVVCKFCKNDLVDLPYR